MGVAYDPWRFLEALDAGYSVEPADPDEEMDWMRLPFREICLNEMEPEVQGQVSIEHIDTRVEEFSRNVQTAEFMEGRTQQLFIAYAKDGEKVGIAWAHMARGYFDDRPKALLFALYVKEEHRRRNVATLLVERVKHWAAEHKAKQVWVSTGSTLECTASRGLYRSLGFRPDWISYQLDIEYESEDEAAETTADGEGRDVN